MFEVSKSLPLYEFASIPHTNYEDPFAKETLDMMRLWACGYVSGLPEALMIMRGIYGGQIIGNRWDTLKSALTGIEDDDNEAALAMIEEEYRKLRPRPSTPPSTVISRPRSPPGMAESVHRPSPPHSTVPPTLEAILQKPELITHGRNLLERKYFNFQDFDRR